MQQQISSLNGQLTVLGQGQAAVVSAMQGAQQDVVSTQTQVSAVQGQVNAANARLQPVTRNLFSVSTQIRKDQQQLSSMLVSRYEASTSVLPVQIDPPPTADELNALTGSIATEQRDARSLQAQINQQVGPINSAMQSLVSLYQLEQGQRDAYKAQADQLAGQTQNINTQIAKAQFEVTALRYGNSGSNAAGGAVTLGGIPPFGLGSRFDAFPWGQCTWYVASLRDVTWWGDAWMWAGNAAAQGYAEGMTPKVGSIVVWGPGHGYSGYGHVAYVAAVSGPADFVVDEANYVGLGVVSQRHITTVNDIEAFIY